MVFEMGIDQSPTYKAFTTFPTPNLALLTLNAAMDKRIWPAMHHRGRRLFSGHNRYWNVLSAVFLLVLMFWWLNRDEPSSTNAIQTGKQVGKDNTLTFYEKMMKENEGQIDNAEELQHKIIDGINHKHINDMENYDNHPNERTNTRENQHTTTETNVRNTDRKVAKNKPAQVLKNTGNPKKVGKPQKIEKPRDNPIKQFFEKLFPIIESAEPTLGYMSIQEMEELKKPKRAKVPKTRIPRTQGGKELFNIALHENGNPDPKLSKSYLESCLQVPNPLLQTLKQSHAKFVNAIPKTYREGTYKGNGIVLIGGAKFSWLSLLGVENLRAVGSILPVEVMIPQPDEYEPQLCEVILPRLNARCVLLYNFIPDAQTKKLSGYQYKSLSLLASSFEKVLLLDSDNIAIKNPDKLFYTEPFTTHGMIFWPDFWRRVTHPKYYDISGKKIGTSRVRFWSDTITPPELYNTKSLDPDVEIALHDLDGTIPDVSSESGQLIINKKTHFQALLLSFYYNVYGPRHYYPLFSQGSSGEGDKETFIAAASFYELPYYQVKKPVKVVGHWDKETYHGVGMIQYDPIIDMQNGVQYKTDLDKLVLEHEEHGDVFQYRFQDFLNYFNRDAEPMFFHCNFPKLDPIGLVVDGRLGDEKGIQWRLYEDQPDVGFDFELRQWQLINHYFCTEDFKLDLVYLRKSPVPSTVLCSVIQSRLRFLTENPLSN